MRKLRKLRKGEFRYSDKSDRKVIYKPKNIKRWKLNKKYNRSSRLWFFSLPSYYKVKAVDVVEKVKRYYKTHIEFKFSGRRKDRSVEYEFMKIRIWINDTGVHSEQDMKWALRDVLRKVFKDDRIGYGIARKVVMYSSVRGIEIKEISRGEANDLGNYQYYIVVRGHVYKGSI